MDQIYQLQLRDVTFWTGWQIPLFCERVVKMIDGSEKLNCVQQV